MKLVLSLALSFILVAQTFAVQKSKGIKQPLINKGKNSFLYTAKGRVEQRTGILRADYRTDKQVFSGSPEDIARQYLRLHHQTYGLTPSVGELMLQQVQPSPAGYHVRFNQSYENVPVFHGDVVVSINKKNQVSFVVNNNKQVSDIRTTSASLLSADATTIARREIDIQGKIQFEEEPVLYIYNEGAGSRLTYRTVITTNNPRGAWEIFVDANNGEIVKRTDINVYDNQPKKTSSTVDGTGYVFNPNPLATSGQFYNATGYTDNNDATSTQLNAQRKLVTLRDITSSSGTYYLTGPYVTIDDWDTPFIPVVTASHPDSFRFSRNQVGFEDVTVYFHMDSTQRYLQSLGFTNIQNLSIHADPHGDDSADNAYFNPSNNSFAFGQGGVDDGEDAEVILHEYGHSIHQGTVNGWGGLEEGHLGEGFGDYWSTTYTRNMHPTFAHDFFPTWDAGYDGIAGRIWPGRTLVDTRIYPNNGVVSMEVHDAGQIWSSVLLSLWDDLGKEVMDYIVLQSHYFMGTYGTMRDNAAAVIQAEQQLYGGEHYAQLVSKFYSRNFLTPIAISHQSLHDVEQTSVPYTVNANLNDGYFTVDTSSVQIIWGRNGAFTDSSIMHQVDFGSECSGAIPTDNSSAYYQYYIKAKDSYGNIVTYPFSAPSEYFSFYAGPDTVKPRVTFRPLVDQAYTSLPPSIKVITSDNIGIDSVKVEFLNRRSLYSGSFTLEQDDDSTYTSIFPFDTLNTLIGDSIYYRVIVNDKATISNHVVLPSSDYYGFKISLGNILIVKDDTTHIAPVSSFDLFYSALLPTSFTLDTVKFSQLAQRTLSNYQLIILSSGLNIVPLSLTSLRQNIVDYVTAGGKVLTEGGEVGHFYRKGGPFDTAPLFRRAVLHDSIWTSHVTGSNLTFSSPTHRIFTSPNIINSPIEFTDRTSGSFAADRDAVSLITGDLTTKIVGVWSTLTSTGGILVFSPPVNQPPQTIFYSFALSSITDTTVAKKLVINTVNAFFPRNTVTAVTENEVTIPSTFALSQNFPNPFNPVSEIRYSLPFNSYVSLIMYDVLGREVATLVNEQQPAGVKTQFFDGGNLPSGVYYYRLYVSDIKTHAVLFQQVKKALLIK